MIIVLAKVWRMKDTVKLAEPLEFEMISASNRVHQIFSTYNCHVLMEAITIFRISSPIAGITHHKSNLAKTAQYHWKMEQRSY